MFNIGRLFKTVLSSWSTHNQQSYHRTTIKSVLNSGPPWEGISPKAEFTWTSHTVLHQHGSGNAKADFS